MDVILFEDDRVPQLDPVATGRPAYAIHCGSHSLVELARRLGPVRSIVRPLLWGIEFTDHPDRQYTANPPKGPCLWLNARLVPSATLLKRIAEWAEAGVAGIVLAGESVAAALLTGKTNAPSLALSRDGLGPDYSAVTGALRQLGLPAAHLDLPLIEYPHDIIRHHQACLRENLELRIADGFQQLSDGLFVGPDVSIGEHVVTDTRNGPIVMESGVSIGPFCYLTGPAYLGPGARLIEHASIKDGVSLGHTTKIGGEVEASIIEPYTNKQHHGFLGHSYLGSWVNLGAGTSTSDLKNTYGPINMEYRGRKVATGMQFVGCFVGDYVKTAINTGIFTGKTVGVCSMVYGFATTNVPSFVNYARMFGQITELLPDVMIATQQRMFLRRGVVQRPCDIQLIRDMYEVTRHERQLAGERLLF